MTFVISICCCIASPYPSRGGLAEIVIWPSHSVKDRIALNMITKAEEAGLISPDKTTLVRHLDLQSLHLGMQILP